jgi:membrane-associated phospholipid phosphatase
MLSSRGRSALLALVLLVAAAGVMAAVGRTALGMPTDTWLDPVGRWDASVHEWIRGVRTGPLIDASEILDLVGGSVVMVPVRIAILLVLALLRRFSAFFAFAVTWAITQPATEGLKGWLHRGRPPDANSFVDVTTFAMPSGHTVALTSVAVAAAIAFATGWWRGGLVLLGFVAGAVMGASRLILSTHWLSDVVAAVLFGGGVAIASAVIVDAFADRIPEGASLRRGRE